MGTSKQSMGTSKCLDFCICFASLPFARPAMPFGRVGQEFRTSYFGFLLPAFVVKINKMKLITCSHVLRGNKT